MAKSKEPYKDNKNKNLKQAKVSKNNKKINKDMEQTTRIRIDKERLNDYDSLDTSFLESRINKKVKNSPAAREKFYKEQKHSLISLNLIGRFLLLVIILLIIVFLVYYFGHNFFSKQETNKSDNVVVDEKVKEEISEEKEIDDNYLFVGDFYTEEFDFSEFDYHYVKEADKKYTTDDILNDMRNKIYIYNPSVVFIELGINDLNNGKSEDEIIDNLSSIIDGIKENRPYAKIYLESIYPINKDVDDYDDDILDDEIDNDLIAGLNKKIEQLVDDKNINYFDVYSFISENNSLKEDYTDDGVYLNNDGYERIKKEIKRVVD